MTTHCLRRGRCSVEGCYKPAEWAASYGARRKSDFFKMYCSKCVEEGHVNVNVNLVKMPPPIAKWGET